MAEKLEVLITAKDEASKVFRGIGDTLNSAFKVGLGVGIAGVGLLAAGLGAAVGEAMEAEVNIAKLEAVLRSTGGVAGVTSQEAQSLADSLSEVTRFSDDAILKGETMLLTFTNIGEDVFPRATESMLDMAEMFGGVDAASVALGKALNDPVQGVTALRRMGVQLTDDQEKLIKKLVETGDVAGAQAVILGELEKEFGGVARAAGSTLAGKLTILRNRLLNIAEAVGMKLLPALVGLVERALSPAVDWIGKMANIFGTLYEVAAKFGLDSPQFFGFLTKFFGSETAAKFQNILGIFEYGQVVVSTFADLLGSEGLGGAVRWLFTTFEDGSSVLETFFQKFGMGSDLAHQVADAINAVMTAVFDFVALVGDAVVLLAAVWAENWGDIQTFFTGTVWPIIQPVLQELKDWLDTTIPNAIDTLTAAFEDPKAFAISVLATALTSLNTAIQGIRSFVLAGLAVALTFLNTAIGDARAVVIEGIAIALTALSTAIDTVRPVLIQSIADALLSLGEQLTIARASALMLMAIGMNLLGQAIAQINPNTVIVIGLGLSYMALSSLATGLTATATGISAIASSIVAAGSAAVAAAAPFVLFGLLIYAFQSNLGGINDSIDQAGEGIREGNLTKALDGILDTLTAIPRGLAQMVLDVAGLDISVPEGLSAWEGVFENLQTIISALPGYIDSLMEKALGFTVGDVWVTFRDTVVNIWNHITGFVDWLFDAFQSAMDAINVPQVWETLKTIVQTIFTTINDLANTAIGAFQSALNALTMPAILTSIADMVAGLLGDVRALAGALGDLNSTTPEERAAFQEQLFGPGPGRQLGGLVRAGQPYRTEEIAAEGFIPLSRGIVVPHDIFRDLKRQSGGNTYTLNVYTNGDQERIIDDFALMRVWAGG